MRQRSFTDIEYASRRHKTKRELFLEQMDAMIPWDDWISLIRPFYPSSRRGRPVRGIEIMLRMYLLQNWFSLSDAGVEDAVYDSYAMRSFVGVDFSGGAQVPDSTTLCRFRAVLIDNGLSEYFRDAIKRGVSECARQKLEYTAQPKSPDLIQFGEQLSMNDETE